MKKLLAVVLALAAPFVSAKTYEDSFNEAIEQRNESACHATFERLSGAGCIKHMLHQPSYLRCQTNAEELKERCLDEIAALNEQDREEKLQAEQQKQQEKKQELARAETRDRLKAAMNGKGPDIELACKRTSARRTEEGKFSYTAESFFQPLIVLKIWSGGACEGVGGLKVCGVDSSSIVAYGDYSFTISRADGTMSMSYRDKAEATYSCQRATAATNKF